MTQSVGTTAGAYNKHDAFPKPAAAATVRLLLFRMDGQGFALHLENVERVVRAVALEPLPGAPDIISGVFNFHGKIVPVGNLRRRLGNPDKPIGLTDQIIIVRTPSRLLGVIADGETDVGICAAGDIVAAETLTCGEGPVAGVGKMADGLVVIHDLARFLSLEEDRQLTKALDADR